MRGNKITHFYVYIHGLRKIKQMISATSFFHTSVGISLWSKFNDNEH